MEILTKGIIYTKLKIQKFFLLLFKVQESFLHFNLSYYQVCMYDKTNIIKFLQDYKSSLIKLHAYISSISNTQTCQESASKLMIQSQQEGKSCGRGSILSDSVGPSLTMKAIARPHDVCSSR